MTEQRFKQIHILMNPVSGANPITPETMQDTLEAVYAPLGITWTLTLTEPDSDVPALAKAAAEAGADVVAAYGGDGTVMDVARGLMETDIPVAILPAGTANVMSVELGVPQTLEAALTLASGESATVRAVDMGMVNNEHYFMLRVGLGLEAEMTVNTPREEKQRLGRLAYFKTAILSLINSNPVRYQLTIDGKQINARGITCVICNSGNVGVPNLSFAPGIDVSDGLFDVLVMRERRTLLTVAWSTLRSVLPNAEKDGTLPHYTGREITVRTQPAQVIGIDGEHLEIPFPFTVKVIPKAAKVIVPQ